MIDGWAEALEEDLTHEQLLRSCRAAPMVQHIRVSVDQMRGLISGLLAHSMARDQALDCELVPLRNLVKHIAATLETPGTAARSSPATCSTCGPTGSCCARCSTT